MARFFCRVGCHHLLIEHRTRPAKFYALDLTSERTQRAFGVGVLTIFRRCVEQDNIGHYVHHLQVRVTPRDAASIDQFLPKLLNLQTLGFDKYFVASVPLPPSVKVLSCHTKETRAGDRALAQWLSPSITHLSISLSNLRWYPAGEGKTVLQAVPHLSTLALTVHPGPYDASTSEWFPENVGQYIVQLPDWAVPAACLIILRIDPLTAPSREMPALLEQMREAALRGGNGPLLMLSRCPWDANSRMEELLEQGWGIALNGGCQRARVAQWHAMKVLLPAGTIYIPGDGEKDTEDNRFMRWIPSREEQFWEYLRTWRFTAAT